MSTLSIVPDAARVTSPAVPATRFAPAAGLAIERIAGAALRRNPLLIATLATLAGPSYDDPSTILAREVAGCTHLYLGREADGRPAGFVFTTRSVLDDGAGLPLLHFGWSAARADLKNSGATMALFEHCILDTQAWERQLGRPALLWATTASPTIYLGIARFLADVEPHCDGRYTDDGARLAALLRARLGAPAGGHPFALRGVAAGTRYAVTERRRIDQIRDRKRFALFAALGIDERCGDRLLVMARTPPDIGGVLSRASRLAALRRQPAIAQEPIR